MGLSLAEQLAKKGLVSNEAALSAEQEASAERLRSARGIAAKTVKGRADNAGETYGLLRLDDAKDSYVFGEIARRILIENFAFIGEVINKAHRFKSDKDFIWRMYQIRNRYPKCPTDKREQFLTRAFRRHNPTVDIPE